MRGKHSADADTHAPNLQHHRVHNLFVAARVSGPGPESPLLYMHSSRTGEARNMFQTFPGTLFCAISVPEMTGEAQNVLPCCLR